MKLFCYPKCSTCKKAVKFLDEHQVNYEYFDYTVDTPTITELKEIHEKSGLPLKRLFNTSGLVYRELEMKDKVDALSATEAYQLLSEHPMLIKRPLILGDIALIGFKETEWEKELLKK